MSVTRKTTVDKIFVVARMTERGDETELLITALEQIIEDLQELGQQELESGKVPQTNDTRPQGDT